MNSKNKTLRRLKSEMAIANEAFNTKKQKGEFNEPDKWTIITALNRVLEVAEDSQLSDELWETCKKPLAFLRRKLRLTNVQIVILAIMVEFGEAMSWKRIGNFLGCTRLSIMVYSEEIEELVSKRWVIKRATREIGGMYDGFALVRGVIKALRHNKAFVPEKIDGFTEQQFVDKLESHIDKNMNDRNIDFNDDEEWMLLLVKANQHLPLCQEIMKFDDIHVQSLLLMIIFDYAQWEGSDSEGLQLHTIDNLYPDEFDCDFMRHGLMEGSHPLIRRGYIEHKCANGQVNDKQYVLTRKTKETLLSAYQPSRTKCSRQVPGGRFMKSHTTIKEKPLFFNTSEQNQIERLTGLLSQDSLTAIQQRLTEQGMRKGFACLFYGAPGTGKTETVLQIARQTGRDLMQVDIAGLRDKFVGESEKNIKEVFTRYRKLCNNSEVMPILFFNEADAIFNKRKLRRQDGQRRAEHHPAGDGRPRRHPHRHHQPDEQPRQCLRTPFHLQGGVPQTRHRRENQNLVFHAQGHQCRRCPPIGRSLRLLRWPDREHRTQAHRRLHSLRQKRVFRGNQGILSRRTSFQQQGTPTYWI